MTESEAWLKIAKEVLGSKKPVGLCYRIAPMRWLSRSVCDAMIERLKLFFPPSEYWQDLPWYWRADSSPRTNKLRATACCFLAAMADD